MWLEAPVEEDDGRGGKTRTTTARDMGRGVPQGAPISPLLANLYMRRFVLGWKRRGLETRLGAKIVVYADDLVICCRGNAEEAMSEMRRLMMQLKLTVNEAKTHIRRLPQERFAFLGYDFGRYYSPKTGRAHLCPQPSKASVKRGFPASGSRTRPQAFASGGYELTTFQAVHRRMYSSDINSSFARAQLNEPAFKGKKGAGKGVWMHALLTVFGPHGMQIFNREHLTGKHNKHLQNRLLLCADEAVWAGDKEAERVLKGLVTEPSMTIEPKGIDAFTWPNRLGIVQSTNEKWVVPASADERRYAVFEVSSVHMPRYDVPQTKALIDQKVQSLDGLEQWWLAKLSNGETPRPWGKNPRWILSKALLEEAMAHNPKTKYLTDTELGRFLGEMCCEHKSNGKAWGWVFPPLAEARGVWERRMGGKWDWLRPDVTEWNEK